MGIGALILLAREEGGEDIPTGTEKDTHLLKTGAAAARLISALPQIGQLFWKDYQ